MKGNTIPEITKVEKYLKKNKLKNKIQKKSNKINFTSVESVPMLVVLLESVLGKAVEEEADIGMGAVDGSDFGEAGVGIAGFMQIDGHVRILVQLRCCGQGRLMWW